MAVHKGRYTADPTGDVTVFLIGMRINKPWLVHKWLPVMAAMPRMLVHLYRHPETGFLGEQQWFGRTTLLVSYWRSGEDLIRFAADTEAPHAEPWRAFRKRVGDSGAVGIYHETYTVHAGEREAVYNNMPEFGLAKAIGHQPVGQGTATATQRLAAGRHELPAVS